MALLALFIAVPLVEIALFIQVGSLIGLGWTLLIVVVTAIIGTYVVRRQGRDVLLRLQRSIDQLRDPSEPLAHGAMILFSGALLLTPGFFTDAVGFALLVPAVRNGVFRWLRARVTIATAPRPGSRPRDTVIEGDWEEVAPERRPPPDDPGGRPSGWTRH